LLQVVFSMLSFSPANAVFSLRVVNRVALLAFTLVLIAGCSSRDIATFAAPENASEVPVVQQTRESNSGGTAVDNNNVNTGSADSNDSESEGDKSESDASEGGSTGKSVTNGNNNSGQTQSFTKTETDTELFDSDSYLLMVNVDEIVKVSPITGEFTALAQLPCWDEFTGPADVINDEVYVTANDNTLKAYSATSGKRHWNMSLGWNHPAGLASPAVCVAPICYVRDTANEIVAVDVDTQTVLWTRAIETSREKKFPANGEAILVSGGRVFLTTRLHEEERSALKVLNRFTGKIEKTIYYGNNETYTPVIVNSMLIVPIENSLLAYDLESLELLWQSDFIGTGGIAGTGEIVIAENTIVFNARSVNDAGKVNGRILVGVDLNSGSINWTLSGGLDSSTHFTPQTNGKIIYTAITTPCDELAIGCRVGNPIAIEATTGNTLWKTRNVVYTDPLVASGRVFFSTWAENATLNNDTQFVSLNALSGAVTMQASNTSGAASMPPMLKNQQSINRIAPFRTYQN